MAEFTVTVKSVEGPQASSDGTRVLLNVTDEGGHKVSVGIPTEQAYPAALGVIVAADTALMQRGSRLRPVFQVDKLALGSSPEIARGECVQTIFLRNGGKVSFQFDRVAAKELCRLLKAFLRGELTADERTQH